MPTVFAVPNPPQSVGCKRKLPFRPTVDCKRNRTVTSSVVMTEHSYATGRDSNAVTATIPTTSATAERTERMILAKVMCICVDHMT